MDIFVYSGAVFEVEGRKVKVTWMSLDRKDLEYAEVDENGREVPGTGRMVTTGTFEQYLEDNKGRHA